MQGLGGLTPTGFALL